MGVLQPQTWHFLTGTEPGWLPEEGAPGAPEAPRTGFVTGVAGARVGFGSKGVQHLPQRIAEHKCTFRNSLKVAERTARNIIIAMTGEKEKEKKHKKNPGAMGRDLKHREIPAAAAEGVENFLRSASLQRRGRGKGTCGRCCSEAGHVAARDWPAGAPQERVGGAETGGRRMARPSLRPNPIGYRKGPSWDPILDPNPKPNPRETLLR